MGRRSISAPRILLCAYACLANPGFREPGGGDLMAWNVVTRLSRSCEVWVLTSALNRPAIEGAAQKGAFPGLHFAYAGLPRWLQALLRMPGGVQIYMYLWQWRAYFVARRLHQQIGFDAFHHLTYTNDWMASPAGALLPLPYLRGPGGGAHRTPPQFVRRYPPRGRLWEHFRAFGQWVLRHDPFFILGQSRAKAILVCNQEALDAIPRKWRHKARLFPVNGVSPEAFAHQSDKTVESREFRVLTAGRLVRLKAFDLAIRAFAAFSSRLEAEPGSTAIPGCVPALPVPNHAPPLPTLTIIGEGPERPRLEALARELGLGGFVNFAGWKPRQQLWARMRSADVFLFPSLRDGGGLVVVEAMAAGKPVVCAELGGPGMHVTPACGFKIKPETPEQFVSDLATALETLYQDPNLCQKMGAAARKRAEESYSWDGLAERMSQIYQEILGLAPAARLSELAAAGSEPASGLLVPAFTPGGSAVKMKAPQS